MLKLIVTVCSILHTEQCKTVDLVFDVDGVSPLQCIMSPIPQIEIAKWQEAHPNWSIRRWKCTVAGLEQDI